MKSEFVGNGAILWYRKHITLEQVLVACRLLSDDDLARFSSLLALSSHYLTQSYFSFIVLTFSQRAYYYHLPPVRRHHPSTPTSFSSQVANRTENNDQCREDEGLGQDIHPLHPRNIAR